MVTLGEFLNLIDNFYAENSLIKVYDVKKVAEESDCLADDDVMGFCFGVNVGATKNFLNSIYENAEVMSIYIDENSVLKVLINTHDEDKSDAQMDLYDKRSEKIYGQQTDENTDSV